MAEIIFRAEKVVKQYKKKKNSPTLNGIDMEIHKGDIYGFVGQNGAGKTTLIRILAGFVSPTSGNIELFGESNPQNLCQKRSQINGIIEGPALYPGLTALDNLEICRLQRGIKDKECIGKVLEIVGLTGASAYSTKVKNFSLGMKQRLGIAKALLGKPQFLFFDEPLNGLDPVGIRDFHELIRMMNKSGITILISSHMLRELNSLATCYGFIHNGKMIEQISAEELTEKFQRYMLLAVNNTDKAVEILTKKLGITRLEVVSDDTIHLYEKFNKSGEIMKALITNGITVEEMTMKGGDLEKYYFSLIKGYA